MRNRNRLAQTLNTMASRLSHMPKPSFREEAEMDVVNAQQLRTSNNWEMLSLEEALDALDSMIQLPSVKDFIHLSQKCMKEKNLSCAKRLHTQICNKHMESHRAVGSCIVPMFVECGSMLDAQKAFNTLVHPNVYSWTSLISGYIQCGQYENALNLYQNMQVKNVIPSKNTLIVLLKACARLKDLGRGRNIHIKIKQKGLETDLFVGSTLVDMYAKCGSLSEALEVFDKLPVRNVVSWTALIAGYAEHGYGQEAVNFFDQMQLDGISPTTVTFACILKACGSMKAIDKGREIHKAIIQKGFESNLFVGSSLVNMYAKCGSLLVAQKVFDKLPVRNVVSWNVLMVGYTEHGRWQEVLKYFEQMQLEGIYPDAVSFICILKACGSLGAIHKGREIHMDIIQKKFDINRFVCNTLVGMYAKCGSFSEAWEVFDKLPVRDVVSWNTIIAGYAEHGFGQEALECFGQMKLEGVCPDAITFACILKVCGRIGAIENGREIHLEVTQNKFERDPFVGDALVNMYAKCGSLSEAREVFDKLPVRNVVVWTSLISGYAEYGPAEGALKCFEQMQLEGVSPDVVSFICIMKACGSIGAIGKGREIHTEIIQKGFESDPFIGSALIDMYVKCGSLSEAQEIFDKLPARDVVLWTALIAGYAEHGSTQQALECFERMQMEGISPNVVTFVCGLKACGNIGAIDKGKEIHTKVMQKGFERDIFVGSTLIEMYAKCGLLSEARKVFDKLPVQAVVPWNTMISGYGMNFEVSMAIRCFEDMQKRGVKPDAITFTCLLTACSHACLIFKGQEYFKMMKGTYGIVPTIYHYTCMVDLLARSGHLHEAEKFLETIPCSPSPETWRALLSACKIYGEVQIGDRCFQQLRQMDPEDSSSYVLMANIYAIAGRWDDACRIEELRKLAGAKKKPANALIEVNQKVHEFGVGNNQSKEIAAMLEFLNLRMQEEGYIPNSEVALKSIFGEVDALGSCEHVEKLAIAFGFLNTPLGQTLHVTKNIRMCDSCHDASKIISRIERREIIVRDSYCVHHFKNGLCSCALV